MAGTTGPTSAPERLPRIFAGIVTLEALVILALYFAGVYFAS